MCIHFLLAVNARIPKYLLAKPADPPKFQKVKPMEKPETKEFRERRSDLRGSVALVTGASHGIGLACARRLALDGCAVVLVSRTADSLKEVERSFVSEGLEARSTVCDVCDLDAFAALINGLDRLDILVNNAGGNRPGPFVDVTRHDFDWLVDLNVRSVFFASQAALRKMMQTGTKGSIINIFFILINF